MRILWKRRDCEGHEAARLDGTVLRGMAVLQDAALAYRVTCDDAWRTISARVEGWAGEREIAIAIEAKDGRWTMNGTHVPEVEDCVDVDLNFSPSTNLLPIRRLDLAVGASAPARAAWLRFPSFALEPLDQVYRRTGPTSYRYESTDGTFVRDLRVNDAGFVIDYPGFWELG